MLHENEYTVFQVQYDSVNNILNLDFGDKAASNDEILRYVEQKLQTIKFTGGKILKINGKCSIPVAYVVCHAVVHLYSYIAIFDPKLGQYLVTVQHGPDYVVGDSIIG